MSNFNYVIDKLLKIEGGYVDHPNDRGGATNWGITIGTLSAWRGKKVTKDDVKKLTQDEAKKIYKKNYWDAINLDSIISVLVAELVFDQSVNRGPKTAAKNLQESANKLLKVKLVEDGVIGPKSISAINSLPEVSLAVEFFKDAQLDYATIVQKNTSQASFIRGWTNRTHALLDLIIDKAYLSGLSDSEHSLAPVVIERNVEDVIVDDSLTLADKICSYNPVIDKTELLRALPFLDEVKKKEYMLYVDFDLHSSDERAFLINLETGETVMSERTTVGKFTDLDHDGFANKFSNVIGSGMSSLGAMITAEEYGKSVGGWSKFSEALKLVGLEPTLNGNVYDRAIIIHDSTYSENGGRSLGCITFDKAAAIKIIDYLGSGSLVYVNHASLFS